MTKMRRIRLQRLEQAAGRHRTAELLPDDILARLCTNGLVRWADDLPDAALHEIMELDADPSPAQIRRILAKHK